MIDLCTTDDEFLGGRIKLVQPIDGYRAGIDPIFLAASIKPKENENILDVGCGVGAAAIALATRCSNVKVIGIEIQHDLVELALYNVNRNHLNHCIEIVKGDVLAPPDQLASGSFDHIMTNPPYYQEKNSKASPHPGKAQANTEMAVSLRQWINFCWIMLKPKGTFTMIHRAERLGEILALLENKIGELIIYPLWPNPDKGAKRIIIQGRKNVKGDIRLASGMILHGGGNKYTSEGEAILRHAEPLEL